MIPNHIKKKELNIISMSSIALCPPLKVSNPASLPRCHRP
jgi:hypothetical protein